MRTGSVRKLTSVSPQLKLQKLAIQIQIQKKKQNCYVVFLSISEHKVDDLPGKTNLIILLSTVLRQFDCTVSKLWIQGYTTSYIACKI